MQFRTWPCRVLKPRRSGGFQIGLNRNFSSSHSVGPLHEASFADAIDRIQVAEDLEALKRIHRATSLRSLAGEVPGQAVEVVPARWTSIRMAVANLHHARLDCTAKTLANHRSNVRAALRWFSGKGRGIGAARRSSCLDQTLDRASRSLFSRCPVDADAFISARAITPASVTDATLDALMEYRKQSTRLAYHVGARRKIARVWNKALKTIAGWPAQLLEEPAIASTTVGTSWADLPDGLRTGIEACLATYRQGRKGPSGKRRRPAKEAPKFEREGPDAGHHSYGGSLWDHLRSASDIPRLIAAGRRAHRFGGEPRQNGEQPTIYTIDLAHHFVASEYRVGGLSHAELDEITGLRDVLEDERPTGGLTPKNSSVSA